MSKYNVDIWILDKKQLLPLLDSWKEILSFEEQQRAIRFLFKPDKEAYIIYHVAKRKILSRYVDISPKNISLGAQKKGKPFIINSKKTFNLSHTKDMAILAIADGIEIGVDIEAIKISDDYFAIAKRFFHPDESSFLESLINSRHQSEEFLKLWTGKEALVKATGEGITFSLKYPLNQYAVFLNASLLNLSVPNGFVATLAVLNQKPSVTYCEFRY